MRGARVDAFLGGDLRQGQPVIRYATVRLEAQVVVATVWEVADPGDTLNVDVYSFYPVTDDDSPMEIFSFTSYEEAVSVLDDHFPGVSARFVTAGVLTDEYADYLVGT